MHFRLRLNQVSHRSQLWHLESQYYYCNVDDCYRSVFRRNIRDTKYTILYTYTHTCTYICIYTYTLDALFDFRREFYTRVTYL